MNTPDYTRPYYYIMLILNPCAMRSPAQPLNLCMICEEKISLRFPLLCGFFHFILHPSGPRLAAPRWVKASYRWRGYEFGLGEVKFGSG